MIFQETPLRGAYLIEPERIGDERGFFARSWCRDEFEAQGLNSQLLQCNLSFNHRQATLRGMHFQAAPHPETKLVRCTMGAIYDVIVDVRPDSPTFKSWFGIELSALNRQMLYIPGGLAHGFITLQDASEVFYQMSEFFHPECARGVRWNDAAFGIEWPLEPTCIAQKDREYADFGRDA